MDVRVRIALHRFAQEQTDGNARAVALELLRTSGFSNVENQLIIQGVLTVNSAHVTPEELQAIRGSLQGDYMHLAHHEDSYTYWLYVSSITMRREFLAQYPNILTLCELAWQNNCSWLRLDRDIEPLDFLPVYEHDITENDFEDID